MAHEHRIFVHGETAMDEARTEGLLYFWKGETFRALTSAPAGGPLPAAEDGANWSLYPVGEHVAGGVGPQGPAGPAGPKGPKGESGKLPIGKDDGDTVAWDDATKKWVIVPASATAPGMYP